MLGTLKQFFSDLQARRSPDSEALDPTIKSLLGRIHLHARLNGNEVVRRFDEDLAVALADLAVELDSVVSRPSRRAHGSGLVAAAENARTEIDRALATDTRFRELGTFEEALQTLRRRLRDADARRVGRKRWLARLGLLATAAPFLGYSLHWAIGHYYSAALLGHVGIVYPDAKFTLSDEGYYRAAYEDIEADIRRFEDRYFAATRGTAADRIALPSVYDDEVARQWGAARPAEPTNLFIHRVFVRSIKDAHVLDKLGVAVRRVDDTEFYWDRFDLSTDLELVAQPGSVRIRTTRTPVRDVSVSLDAVTILDQRVVPTMAADGHIVTSRAYRPGFGEHEPFQRHEYPVYFRFGPSDVAEGVPAAARGIEVRPPRSEGELIAGLRRLEGRLRDRPLASVRCSDGGAMVIAATREALEQVTRVSEIDSLAVEVDYALLDGRERSRRETLTFDRHFVFIDETHRREPVDLADCLAPALADRLGPRGEVAATATESASSIDAVVAAVDAASRFLADDLRVSGGDIVLEESFHFDLSETPAPTEVSRRNVKILEDGDFVVFNVALMSYPAGVYEFEYLFNDDVVARVRVDPLWPQSLRYVPADDPLFRADGTE